MRMCLRERTTLTLVLAWVLFLLNGCGGGSGLDLYSYDTPVITPIDGNWVGDSGISLNFDESFTANRYFNRSYALSARLNDAQSVECVAESTTRFDAIYTSGRVEFYAEDLNTLDDTSGSLCLTGEFTDLATLVINTVNGEVFDTFRNDRVAVRLDFGGWRSEDGSVEMVFNDPSTIDNDSSRDAYGCLQESGAEMITVFGSMSGLNVTTRYPPNVAPLFQTDTTRIIYSSVLYTDVFTLSATTPQGQTVIFNRLEEVDIDCPSA